MKDEDLIAAEIARDIIAEVAPQEVPLFRRTSEAYFDDPAKILQPQKSRDPMLGFGMSEAVMMLTPIALAVVTDTVKFLASKAGETAKEEGSALLTERIKRFFRKFRPASGHDAPTPSGEEEGEALTKHQLAEVRRRALEKARALGLPAEQADLLADALVGSLSSAG